jgi:uncharacterized protein YaiI (UPF0178 family)
MKILVDADACPVKAEIYRVARRHGLPVVLVANSPMTVPAEDAVRLEVVSGRFDAADDRIVELAEGGDVVVSDDIPLAARAVAKGALVLTPKGRRFDEESIGDAVATREVLAHLREQGVVTSGPAPYDRQHRSQFLDALEATIRAAQRATRRSR